MRSYDFDFKKLSIALYQAAKKGDVRSVSDLLSEINNLDLDPDLKNQILNSKHDDVDDAENKNPKGATALYAAVKGAHVEIVQALLDAGADINLPTTQDSVSPLHAAIIRYEKTDDELKKEKFFKIIEILSENGADYYQINDYFDTPLDYSTSPSLYDKWSKQSNKARSFLDNIFIYPEKFWSNDFLCPMEGQSWLMLFIEAHYKIPKTDDTTVGICNGFSNSVEESLLINNGFNHFNRRLKEMYLIVLAAKRQAWDDYYSEINEDSDKNREKILEEKIKENILTIVNLMKNKNESILNDIPDRFKTTINFLKNSRIQLSDDPDKDADLSHLISWEHTAFCEKILVYSFTSKYFEWFDEWEKLYLKSENIRIQSNLFSSALVQSADLEEQGGRKSVCRFSSIYKLEELTILFESLYTLFETDLNGERFPHPISITIVGNTADNKAHATTITYDQEKKCWLLLDAGHMSFSSDSTTLSKKLFSYFRGTNTLGLKITMHVAQYNSKEDAQNHAVSNVEKIKPFIDHWQTTKEWKNVQTVTTEKAKRISDHGDSWRRVATFNAEPEVAKKCLEKERKNFFLRHWKPLLLASIAGLAILSILITVSIFTFGIPAILATLGLIGTGLTMAGSTLVAFSPLFIIAMKKTFDDNRELKTTENDARYYFFRHLPTLNDKKIGLANIINKSLSSTYVSNKNMQKSNINHSTPPSKETSCNKPDNENKLASKRPSELWQKKSEQQPPVHVKNISKKPKCN